MSKSPWHTKEADNVLSDSGIAYNRMSMAPSSTAVDSTRPASVSLSPGFEALPDLPKQYYEKNKRDTMPSLPGKLNFDEKA